MPDSVRLDDVVVGAPVQTGWSAPYGPPPEGGSLDQLTDVDGTSSGAVGSVLVKGNDGVWRARPTPPAPPLWGDMTRWDDGVPIDEAPTGAVHVDLANGKVYRYREGG